MPRISTIEVCTGLRQAASGVVEILGTRVPARGAAQARLRGEVGVMLQDGGLYATARPLELVAYIASLHHDPLDPATILDALGIDPAIRTPIRRLSGGEQQRVKCAVALVGRPTLAFLDEPTAGLDAMGRRTVHDLVRDLVARGSSVVLTTHLMDDVERLADHVVVIARGRALRTGTVTELVGSDDSVFFRGPLHADLTSLRAALPQACQVEEGQPGRYRVTGATDPMVLSSVASWCAQHGMRTSDVTVGRQSLEDLMIDLVEDSG